MMDALIGNLIGISLAIAVIYLNYKMMSRD
jgi:hypothetical protein